MKKNEKKRLLFVVYYFIQAGGERYIYEILKGLNKEKYEIDFLKIYPLGHNKKWQSEFYYEPTINLGSRVLFWNEILASDKTFQKLSWMKKLFSHIPIGRLKMYIYNKTEARRWKILQDFLNKYQIVNWAGVGVYTHLGRHLSKGRYAEFIHLLTAQFQYDFDCYSVWDKEKHYCFVSPFTEKLVNAELKDFKKYSHLSFPMSLELKPFQVDQKSLSAAEPRVIAVFSRIDRMKPMEPYIYALKLLLEQKVNAVLHIYGAGNPVETGLSRIISHLYIEKHVIFKGHADNMVNTLKQGDISLVWYQSGDNRPAGYAAFEIAMSGIAQVFWDFTNHEDDLSWQNVYPSFTNLTEFVKCSAELLTDDAKRIELGIAQQEFVLQHQDIEKNISILENVFDAV